MELMTNEIQTLECTHTSSADRHDMSEIVDDRLDGGHRHGDDLRVHGVLVGIGYLDGLECARTHMQGDFGCLYASLAQSEEYLVGEMQARSGGSY